MEEIKEAKQQSSNSFSFARLFCGIIFGSIVWTIMTAIFNIIPITIIIIGAVYLDDCRIQRMIPVFLIVFGAVYLLRYTMSTCVRCGTKDDDEIGTEKDADTLRFFNVLLFFVDMFLLIWFIMGSVHVYGNFSVVQFYNTTASSYCSSVAYRFAFWFITIHYIALGMCMFCCPCIICFYYARYNY